jgi:hypothetical protein
VTKRRTLFCWRHTHFARGLHRRVSCRASNTGEGDCGNVTQRARDVPGRASVCVVTLKRCASEFGGWADANGRAEHVDATGSWSGCTSMDSVSPMLVTSTTIWLLRQRGPRGRPGAAARSHACAAYQPTRRAWCRDRESTSARSRASGVWLAASRWSLCAVNGFFTGCVVWTTKRCTRTGSPVAAAQQAGRQRSAAFCQKGALCEGSNVRQNQDPKHKQISTEACAASPTGAAC